ncbi:MAG: hypothetical protein P4N59_12390 [Negativicutes bacterium]|nr:hypothetical protein [Negativicutes bacterium]
MNKTTLLTRNVVFAENTFFIITQFASKVKTNFAIITGWGGLLSQLPVGEKDFAKNGVQTERAGHTKKTTDGSSLRFWPDGTKVPSSWQPITLSFNVVCDKLSCVEK